MKKRTYVLVALLLVVVAFLICLILHEELICTVAVTTGLSIGMGVLGGLAIALFIFFLCIFKKWG